MRLECVLFGLYSSESGFRSVIVERTAELFAHDYSGSTVAWWCSTGEMLDVYWVWYDCQPGHCCCLMNRKWQVSHTLVFLSSSTVRLDTTGPMVIYSAARKSNHKPDRTYWQPTLRFITSVTCRLTALPWDWDHFQLCAHKEHGTCFTVVLLWSS